MSEDIEITNPPELRYPKKRPSRAKLVVAVVVLLLAAAGGVAYYAGLFGPRGAEKAVAGKGEKYTCGMHPWIIQDKPGECPICGMKLTKITEQPGPSTAAPSGAAAVPKNEAEAFFDDKKETKAAKGPRKIAFYRNPMNPDVHSPTPAKDEMGMAYVPVYEDELQPTGAAPEGLATVRVGEESLKLAGVQTATASRDRVNRTVRTVGIVVPDETRVRHVQTKIEGWVEKLHTNFMGQTVRQGQPILSIYSPELLST